MWLVQARDTSTSRAPWAMGFGAAGWGGTPLPGPRSAPPPCARCVSPLKPAKPGVGSGNGARGFPASVISRAPQAAPLWVTRRLPAAAGPAPRSPPEASPWGSPALCLPGPARVERCPKPVPDEKGGITGTGLL